MPALNAAPKLWSFEVIADHEGNPGKFTLRTWYRAYVGNTLVELPVEQTQLFEGSTIDEEFWGEHFADHVTPAFQAAGYTWA